MPIKNKSIEKYNANDVLEYWAREYNRYTNLQYSSPGFANNDLRILHRLLSDYNIYSVLLAIDSAIKNGEASIKYFSERIVDYIPSTEYVYFLYALKNSNNKKARGLLTELLVLEAQWFPTAGDRQRQKEIEERLKVMINIK